MPLRSTEAGTAVLLAARTAGSDPFDSSVGPLVAGFADQAAVALDMAARQQLARRADVYEDRDRIARDLHDHVIQRIFAAGLTLEAVSRRTAEEGVRATLGRTVEDLDETIRSIRASIFELQPPSSPDTRSALLDVVTSSTRGLGFEPALRLEGPVATVLGPALLHDVTAVLREALTNVVKHAGCSAVDVRVAVTAHSVTVEVTDNGPSVRQRPVDGPWPPVMRRHRGLHNLASRARSRHGDCVLSSDERETVLTWTALVTD